MDLVGINHVKPSLKVYLLQLSERTVNIVNNNNIYLTEIGLSPGGSEVLRTEWEVNRELAQFCNNVSDLITENLVLIM